MEKNIVKNILRPFSKVYANKFFACTKHAGEWLFGKKIIERKELNVINNAIDLKKFEFNEKIREDLRKEFGIKKDTIVIGHIGRFMKQKNHDFLIDVFNELIKKDENSILILIGQGPLLNDMKQKVRDLKIEDKVKFIGQVTDVEKYYNIMDVFLFPSIYEGLRNGCNRGRSFRT